MDDNQAWFAPKRFGYGAGWPIRWQGWVWLTAFVALTVLAAVMMLPRRPTTFIAAQVILTILFGALAARHTRGGWRWRWGDR